MNLQNVYRKTLQNMIELTNANQIQTSDELLEKLAHELKARDPLLQSYQGIRDKIYN